MSRTSKHNIFSYPVTRPYPFKWFAWVALIGGVVFTTLFSFIAVAANGYNIESIYTTDPNSTLHKPLWFQKLPLSWANTIEATCQAAQLTPGATYFTSNLGLTYSLSKMWREDIHSGDDEVVPAAAYKNAPLYGCEVALIHVELSRLDFTRFPGNSWSWGATTADATATCTIYTESGPLKADLVVQLPIAKDYDQILSRFLSLQKYIRTSMWCGAQLLHAWYDKIPYGMGYSRPERDTTASWDHGDITLTRNPNMSDYTDLKFFICTVKLMTDKGGLSTFEFPNHTVEDWANQAKQYDLPKISTTVDVFAKIFYSLVLSDLGVNDTSNALLTPGGILYLQSRNDTDLANATNKGDAGVVGLTRNITVNSDNGHNNISNLYDSLVKDLGTPSLNTTPSTIFTQYLCSVPKQKGAGSLFFSVLIADLVFVQALWTVLNWVTVAAPAALVLVELAAAAKFEELEAIAMLVEEDVIAMLDDKDAVAALYEEEAIAMLDEEEALAALDEEESEEASVATAAELEY
ncbi:hypothetical protein LTR08_003853 [Meristemomyces frigidus]|nr:hypothetical protein LTR08_003853 [Meristemomyces frigidus]